MDLSRPTSLPENAGLAFVGETLWEPAQLSGRQSVALLAAHNPTGRPNSDVIRRFVGVESEVAHDYVQIDFPAHFNEQEASLYLNPSSHLRSRHSDSNPTWWLNPHANSALRTTVARLDRYLATPLNAETPAWDWIESERLPTNSLLAMARDDDFTHGVLQSRFFCAWWHTWLAQLPPRARVESFPFPWAPATLLSALSRTQQEHRLAIVRAARSGGQDQLDIAVATAYENQSGMTDDEIVALLKKLNRQRAPSQVTK